MAARVVAVVGAHHHNHRTESHSEGLKYDNVDPLPEVAREGSLAAELINLRWALLAQRAGDPGRLLEAERAMADNANMVGALLATAAAAALMLAPDDFKESNESNEAFEKAYTVLMLSSTSLSMAVILISILKTQHMLLIPDEKVLQWLQAMDRGYGAMSRMIIGSAIITFQAGIAVGVYLLYGSWSAWSALIIMLTLMVFVLLVQYWITHTSKLISGEAAATKRYIQENRHRHSRFAAIWAQYLNPW